MWKILILCFLLINPSNLLLSSSNPYDYSSIKAKSVDEDLTSQTVESTQQDESCIYISSTESIFSNQNCIINKNSGDSTKIEDSNLYGVNSAVLVQGGATLSLQEGTITSKAKGAHGIFSTNDGNVLIQKSIVTTEADSTSGIISTYKGSSSVTESTISTNGNSSPLSVSQDGEIILQNSILSTKGKGSDLGQTKGEEGTIIFDGSTGTAENSKIAVVEGLTSLVIQNQSELKCSATPTKNEVDQCGIFMYQSGSRSMVSNSFNCKESKLEILESSKYYKTAPMFLVTNNGAGISIENCQFKFGSNTFISVKATDEWGVKGSNSGDATVLLTDQNIEGDFLVDAESTLHIILKNSHIIGKINPSNTVKTLSIQVDKDSTITITGDSYCSLLINEIQDGSNLINGSYTWHIGVTPNTGSAQGYFNKNLMIIGLNLILSLLLL